MDDEITSYPERQDESHRTEAYEYLSHLKMAPRLGAIAALLNVLRPKNILDVGCGVGYLLISL